MKIAEHRDEDRDGDCYSIRRDVKKIEADR